MLGQGKRGMRPGVVLLLKADEVNPNPNQPRRQFDARELQGLADSIRENGILQPLTVRRLPGGSYELIAGERRLRAARLAGLQQVPCLLAEADSERSAVLALVENIQRQDLGFFEEAEAIARLMAVHGFSQEQLARSLGRAASTLSNKLRLLKLPLELRAQITAAGLTERHARALLRITDPERQRDLCQRVIAKGLTVQETDKLIEAELHPLTGPKRPAIRLVRDVRIFVNTIQHAVDKMRSSGIDAVVEKAEAGEHMVYTVRIPKGEATRRAG